MAHDSVRPTVDKGSLPASDPVARPRSRGRGRLEELLGEALDRIAGLEAEVRVLKGAPPAAPPVKAPAPAVKTAPPAPARAVPIVQVPPPPPAPAPRPARAASGKGPSLAEALRDWLEAQSRNWTSPRTRRNFEVMLEAWLAVLDGGLPLAEIGPLEVQKVYLARDNGNRSGAWIDKERATLHAFFNRSIGLGLIEKNPVTKASWPRKGRKGARSKRSRIHILITPEILQRILGVAPFKYASSIVFLYFTGLRLGEFIAARWSWVVPDPQELGSWLLRVPGANRKTRQDCVIILGRRAVEVLGPRGAPDDLLFPEITSGAAYEKMLQTAGEQIGIERLGPHQFRRSCATNLLNQGMPLPQVTRQMGWTQAPREVLEMLRDSYYLGLAGREVRRIADSIRTGFPPEPPAPPPAPAVPQEGRR
jgi:integrase